MSMENIILQEELDAYQSDVQQNSANSLTEKICEADCGSGNVRDYRQARDAERDLIIEPDLDVDAMTYRDYRAFRTAQRRQAGAKSFGEMRNELDERRGD